MNMFSSHYIRASALACLLLFLQACRNEAKPVQTVVVTEKDFYADTSLVPNDTLPVSAVQATREGLYLYQNRKFSGYLISYYANKRPHTIASIYNGMTHGAVRSYYENGSLQEVRRFKENLNTGKQYGYWPNGKQKFEYVYYRDKKAGEMKRWYESGKPYLALHYSDDKEEGLQQGWRENGKLFINYVAKDGYRYGLQETMLCYKLDKGEVIK